MMRMVRRFQIFLGLRRFRWFVILLAGTGLGSLLISLLPGDALQMARLQSALALLFILGAGGLILGSLPREERWRWLAVVIPAGLAMLIGSLALPQWTGLFVGGGIGWIVAGIFVFNSFGAPQQYKKAIRAMRKQDYPLAIESISALIRDERDAAARAKHYRFRAELHRLAGKLGQARRDYQKMIDLESDSAVAYNGLAEVELQAGNYRRALDAAGRANELAPDEWVALYNLGMIEDRLQLSEAAIRHLRRALDLGMPDSRHRLLVHLYLLRAYLRCADEGQAAAALADMQGEQAGLAEWELVMGADEAQALREVLSGDIELARALIKGEKTLMQLGGG